MARSQQPRTILRLATVAAILVGSIVPAGASTWNLRLILLDGLELFPSSGDWGNPGDWINPNPGDGQTIPGPGDNVRIRVDDAGGFPTINLDVPVNVNMIDIGAIDEGIDFGADVRDISVVFDTPSGGQDVFVNEFLIQSETAEGTSGLPLDEIDFGLADVDFNNVNLFTNHLRLERAPDNFEGRVTLELFGGSINLNGDTRRIDLLNSQLAFKQGARVAGAGEVRLEGVSSVFSGATGHTIQSDVRTVNSASFIVLEEITEGERVATVVEGAVNGPGDWFLGNRHELTLRQTDPATASPSVITGDIVGPGRLRIEGEGNVVELRGASSVSDGTIVTDGATLAIPSASRLGTFGDNFLQLGSGGTLRATGDFTIGLPVFSAGGGFDTNGNAVVIAGALTGPGGSVSRKEGEGTLTLSSDASGHAGDWVVERGDLISATNADTFSDTTSVTVEAAGTLRFFGNEDFAGVDGDGQIAIATGRQMRVGFDNSDHDFAGQVNGPGDIVKFGTGQQRFSGDNSGHTGQWILNGGSFRFGSGKSLSGDLAVNAGRSIFFDPESGESDYAHSLSGDGTVFMSGSGTINLTGDSPGFTGSLLITHPDSQGGTLNVDGTIAPSVLGVEGGGTLGGSGDILGTTTALNNGTIRPTAEAGRLRVDGADFRAGSTFGIDIASASEFSTLRVLGDAAINGATLDVDLVEGFLPVHGDSFLVLRVDGAVTGSGFSSLDLPELAEGLVWNTRQLLTAGRILVEVALPGDYNLDGVVNTADYAVWRDNLGEPAGALPSDIDGGAIGQGQYGVWVAHLGQSLHYTAVAAPEPTSALLIVGLASAWFGHATRAAMTATRRLPRP